MTAVRHLLRTRAPEVCVLQASPLLGAWLGGVDLNADDLAQLAVLLVGSLALTAHVFVLNDWAGYRSDIHDPRRAAQLGISRASIARVALVLLVVAGVTLAIVGTSELLFGAGIAALSVLYSFSPRLGKSTPVAASLNHVAGGVLHFLMGYSLLGAVDGKGAALAVFTGLVFAAGHLNQEVRDHAADQANGIRTSAVVFGARSSFLASFALFTAAYALVVGLAAGGVLPAHVLFVAAVWLVQAVWSRQALARGLDVETALWIQRRYRLLFLVVGLLLLVR